MVLRNRRIPGNLPSTRTLNFEGRGNDLILVLGVNMEWAPWPMSCPSVVIAWGKFTIWFVEKIAIHPGFTYP